MFLNRFNIGKTKISKLWVFSINKQFIRRQFHICFFFQNRLFKAIFIQGKINANQGHISNRESQKRNTFTRQEIHKGTKGHGIKSGRKSCVHLRHILLSNSSSKSIQGNISNEITQGTSE